MKSRSINPSVLRLLYAHSGNRCAFPDCDVPIFEDNGQLTGECCHIEAFSKNGPRYNENMSDEDINGYDNLILMCSRHHKIIDGDPISFSVDRLKEIKTNHEKNYSASTIKLTHFMMEQLQNSSKMFWDKIYSIHAEDTSDLHRDFDITLSATDLMEIVERNFDEIENFIEHFELSDNYLMADLKSLCKLTGWDFERIEQIPYYENPLYSVLSGSIFKFCIISTGSRQGQYYGKRQGPGLYYIQLQCDALRETIVSRRIQSFYRTFPQTHALLPGYCGHALGRHTRNCPDHS